MIRIDFDPTRLLGEHLNWWKTWQEKAADATKQIIAKWESSETISATKDFDGSVWGELKTWLLEHFLKDKCSFCERDLRRVRREMEHYRPKAGVNYKEAGKSKPTWPRVEWRPGQRIKHPGYFWLAYHWKNLFPCCGPCNSDAGKKNQFPLTDPVAKPHVLLQPLGPEAVSQCPVAPHECSKRAGYYYLDPDSLDAVEAPLLLNPYIHDPREHIRFGAEGIEVAREDKDGVISAVGQNTIEVYDLKSDDLRGLRADAQSDVDDYFLIAFMKARKDGDQRNEALHQAYQATIASLKDRNGPFLAASLDWLDQVYQDPSVVFDRARVPLDKLSPGTGPNRDAPKS